MLAAILCLRNGCAEIPVCVDIFECVRKIYVFFYLKGKVLGGKNRRFLPRKSHHCIEFLCEASLFPSTSVNNDAGQIALRKTAAAKEKVHNLQYVYMK